MIVHYAFPGLLLLQQEYFFQPDGDPVQDPNLERDQLNSSRVKNTKARAAKSTGPLCFSNLTPFDFFLRRLIEYGI